MNYKGKLVKVGEEYHLWVNHMTPKISPFAKYPWDVTKQRLSLKNCQAIECGYDFDELINETFDNMGYHSTVTPHEEDQFKLGYKLGFQKAVELMGIKKFTEKDVLKVVTHVLNKLVLVGGFDKQFLFPEDIYQETTTKCKSLQQTEWDVEVEMGEAHQLKNRRGGLTNMGKPKLDVDGCLILKLV